MIRPIDLQSSILNAQTALGARAAEGPRLDAQAAQAAFAAEVTQRDETVAPATEVLGNRIGAKSDERDAPNERPRKRTPRGLFESPDPDATGFPEEPPHIVDFSA